MNHTPIRFPFASNEHARLREVREVLGPDKKPDPVLQKIVERVRELFGSSAALASVVESDHQWFLARSGIDLDSTPRDYSICSRTIMSDAPLILTDTREHPEFSDHPAVVSAPNVRFYAGAPIVLTSGFRVGSLCALDLEPHEVPPSEAVEELKQLAIQIADYLEGKHAERSAGNLETRARIASDAQLEFLSLVGHELRTPLTILLGNARLLRSRLSDEVDTRMVKAIESSGGHLHQLIEHIIRYSNLDSGERTLAEEAISCIDLLRSAASPVEPIAAAADRQLDVECKEGIDTIYADGEQITLALSCLITNAVKHGGGAIEVVAETVGDGTLRLAVFDEGDGLPDRHLSEMEGAFVIGEDLDTRHAGGLGLGLPLAKKIAQLHGGALITGTEGSRTLVEIRLPSWRRRSRMA